MKKALKIVLIIVTVLVLIVVGTFAFSFIRYKYFRREYEGEVISFNALDKIKENSENFDPANYGLTLAWSDDFDGTELDPTKWECCPEWERGDVGARWDDDMVELDGKGNLILKVGLDENNKKVSGAVRTKTKDYRVLFEQARGYFEIRTTLQSIPGYWSAFWVIGDNKTQPGNGASDGAEIDIFESFDMTGGRINHALHWDGVGETTKSLGGHTVNKNLYDGEYHTFGLLWADDGYFYFVDGQLSYSIDATWANFPGSSADPSYIKISNEIGTWAGYMLNSYLPDQIKVDYVKVYSLPK